MQLSELSINVIQQVSLGIFVPKIRAAGARHGASFELLNNQKGVQPQRLHFLSSTYPLNKT